MIALIVCIALAKPPQAPPLLGMPQAPPLISDCRCGDACPLGGGCINCPCAKPVSRSVDGVKPSANVMKTSDGWQWNEDAKCWWRVVGTSYYPNTATQIQVVAPPTPVYWRGQATTIRGSVMSCSGGG